MELCPYLLRSTEQILLPGTKETLSLFTYRCAASEEMAAGCVIHGREANSPTPFS